MFELRPCKCVPGILGVFAKDDIPATVKGSHTKGKLISMLPYGGLVDTSENISSMQQRLYLPYALDLKETNLEGCKIMVILFESQAR